MPLGRMVISGSIVVGMSGFEGTSALWPRRSAQAKSSRELAKTYAYVYVNDCKTSAP